jgi:predicted DNA-binding transcriptional regulator AlpA
MTSDTSSFAEEKVLAMADELPEEGLLRLVAILRPSGPVPVSKSTWWAGVRSGRYPQPVKLGPRITAWRVEDIRTLLQSGSKG